MSNDTSSQVAIDAKTLGAWLVHHTNKMNLIETPPAAFGKISVAGKATQLLSVLSASDDSSLNGDQVTALAHAANIETHLALPSLLGILREARLIDVAANGGVHVLGVTQSTLLQRGAEIFKNLSPSQGAQATIALAEQASRAPIEYAATLEWLGDSHRLSRQEAADVLSLSEQIGFVDNETIDSSRKLYFNGNLFRRDSVLKVQKVIASLTPSDSSRVLELDELLKRQGCVLLENATTMLGEKLLDKVLSVGMFDVSVVSNDSENTSFVTRPAAFSKYSDPFVDDALDLAKALVSSVTYGMIKSSASRGQIRMPDAILNALLRGQWVGPVAAIGQDYKILEMKRVVEIRKEGRGYSMRLLKKEVGEVARDVLTHGDGSTNRVATMPGASITRFQPPESQREQVRALGRKKTITDRRGTTDVLLAIRTGSFSA